MAPEAHSLSCASCRCQDGQLVGRRHAVAVAHEGVTHALRVDRGVLRLGQLLLRPRPLGLGGRHVRRRERLSGAGHELVEHLTGSASRSDVVISACITDDWRSRRTRVSPRAETGTPELSAVSERTVRDCTAAFRSAA